MTILLIFVLYSNYRFIERVAMTARIKYNAAGVPTITLPANREEAMRLGTHAYFTGKVCSHGHTYHRYTASGACARCVSAIQKKKPRTVKEEARAKTLAKWNASPKAYDMKLRWKLTDPKWAWAVSAAGGMRARSAAKGLPCDVDKAYVYAILTDNCPVFGTPFVFIGAGKVCNDSPTVDKIDPARGYVRGNIVIISQRANAIKSNATWKQIRRVADWLRTFVPADPSAEEVAAVSAARSKYAESDEGRQSRAIGIERLTKHNTGRKLPESQRKNISAAIKLARAA